MAVKCTLGLHSHYGHDERESLESSELIDTGFCANERSYPAYIQNAREMLSALIFSIEALSREPPEWLDALYDICCTVTKHVHTYNWHTDSECQLALGHWLSDQIECIPHERARCVIHALGALFRCDERTDDVPVPASMKERDTAYSPRIQIGAV